MRKNRKIMNTNLKKHFKRTNNLAALPCSIRDWFEYSEGTA